MINQVLSRGGSLKRGVKCLFSKSGYVYPEEDNYRGGYSDGPEENAKTLIKLIKERVRKGDLE